MASSADLTTSFLLSNLHCPSCVSSIEEALYSLNPKPQSASASIVSSWVTVRHNADISIKVLQDALEDAGFNISDVLSDARDRGMSPEKSQKKQIESEAFLDQILHSWNSRSSSRLASDYEEKKRLLHVKNCSMCRIEENAGTRKISQDSPGHMDENINSSVSNYKKIASTTPTEVIRNMSSGESFIKLDSLNSGRLWRASLAIGGMTCASCAGAITTELKKQDWVQDVTVNLIANSATVHFRGEAQKKKLVDIIEDIGYEATLDTVVEVNPDKDDDFKDIWTATLAIGGMTCASCSGAITRELEKKDWVLKAVVNLISNSATVDFEGKDHEANIIEMIEDIGYEATVDKVVGVRKSEAPRHRRTVEIEIDGMFCNHCPSKVQAALDAFENQITIDRLPETGYPILKISYVPEAPKFTIRHILAALDAADPAFETSTYHPPTLEERSRQIHSKEQQRILIRVTLTIIIAIPTFIIGIVLMSLVSSKNTARKFFDKSLVAGVSRSQWALFIMATPVYFFCADVFHRRTIKEVRSMWRRGSRTPIIQRFYRFGSMNMLMSLGTSIAYISSVAQLIAAGTQHKTAKRNGMASVASDVFYFDSVVFLTMFLLIGRLIESYSKSKTGDAVTMLGKLRPTTALLVTEQSADQAKKTEMVNVDLLEFDDMVSIVHGGSPPCDGTIIEGESKFDESSLTGEATLVKKSIGDEVYSGTVNKDAPITIRITGAAGESMLDQIVKAVREGQTKRAPIERIADSLTAYFVPFVTLVAVVIWLIWMSLGLSGKLNHSYLGDYSGSWVGWSLGFAIAVFVVACPCGLALAAPTALFVGGGLAAQHGILVKGGGEAFEKASRLNCVVFDKTGTLTLGGEPAITDYHLTSSEQESTVLALVKAVEENSSHPIAKAILSFCQNKTDEIVDAKKIEEVAGKGMLATLASRSNDTVMDVVVGNEALLNDYNIKLPSSTSAIIENWKTEGKSIALAAMNHLTFKSDSDSDATIVPTSSTPSSDSWYLAAAFAISDPIRPEASHVISALHARGTDVWMLSGDNVKTATAVAAKVGIPSTNVIAGVLPSQKAEKIQYLQKILKEGEGTSKESSTERAIVAMIGDGINDSPALTTADVGIAVGSGSDIAISSAEFILVNSNLHTLLTLLDLSRVVFRRIKFNFGWALVYNMIALPVAAGALYPIVSNGSHVRLDPVWASLAMAASSISVVLSSLALRSRVPWLGFRAREREA